ncbi:beta strand repeat-containing protein [Candidatus Methylobacter oryzae]|uniref:Uncharacterized protein n=1 Tax=Candidatus Methylobacter oryzae TaxID=2497749 RepID=A0ABY3CDZ7_9GAMM|nr:hypothetical protein [Candidatus Methylobacter oryzae]TRX01029.1 hypothetical protein EKO24_004470 [Candidatus Methylobacter oryzae]
MASLTTALPETIIARNAEALYDTILGNTDFTHYTALIGSNPDVLLNGVYTNSVGTASTATVASVLVTNLGITDSAAATTAQNYIVEQLNAVAYTERGAVINNILNLFANLASDATFGSYAAAWNTKIVNAVAYSQVSGNQNTSIIHHGHPIGYVLTNGTDIVPASKAVEIIFNADLVYAPDGSKRINSLQDEDNLAGTGTSTLNATLASSGINGVNIVTPKLAGISTINTAFTGSDPSDAVLALNLQNATGVSTVNVFRVSNTANQAHIENINAPLTVLGISNANMNDLGGIEFSFGAGALKGLNTGNLRLDSVQVGVVNIGENIAVGGASAANSFGVGVNSYEKLTINSTGAFNIIGTLNLPMDTGVAGSVAVTGDQSLVLVDTTVVSNKLAIEPPVAYTYYALTTATPAPLYINAIESLTYSGGIAGANGRLATLTAAGLTGSAGLMVNLGAGFFTTDKADTSGVPQDVSVTGSKNSDTFYLGDAIQAGDSLTGGDGQDNLVIYNQGNLVSSGSSVITKIEALEDRQSTTGVSTIAFEKLPDVTSILVRNEGSAYGAPAAASVVFNLNGLNTTQANAITVQHSNSGSNGITQNTVNAALANNTAADTYTLTITDHSNANPRFNLIFNPGSAESITILDGDMESNTVALGTVAGVTNTVTLAGNSADTFLNLDTAMDGANGGLYVFDTSGAGVTPTATLLSGVTDLSLTANQVKIVAATFDASNEASNVIARFSTNAGSAAGAQNITMGDGNDTVIFDNVQDTHAGLTGSDTVAGGFGDDTLAIDGDLGEGGLGTVVGLGASEWTNVSGFETIRTIGAGAGSSYRLILTDDLIAANNKAGVLAIVNDNDTANDSANKADTAGSAAESPIVVDASSLTSGSKFSYNGEEGASATNDRFIFNAYFNGNFNGSHVIDGGAVDNNPSNNSGRNGDVIELRNPFDVSSSDFANIKNIGTIELTNIWHSSSRGSLQAPIPRIQLNDAVVDALVDSYQASNNTTNIERLNIRALDSSDPNTGGIALDASALTGKSALDILLNRGGNTIVTGAGPDKVVLLGNYNGNDYAAAVTENGVSIKGQNNGINAWGIDNIAGTADDVAAQRMVTDTINLGAGNDTLITYGAVNLTGATLIGVETIASNSNITLTAEQYNTLVANRAASALAGPAITFTGAGPHELFIQNNAINNSFTVDLGYTALEAGAGSLTIATTGIGGAMPTITGSAADLSTVGGITVNNVATSTVAGTVAASAGTSATIPDAATIAVAAAGFSDASTANNTYNVTIGSTYTYNASGFAAGDKIAFPAGAAISVNNTSGSDGVVDVVGTLNGNAVIVHLTGIAIASDSAIFGINSFNTVFGGGSLA